MLLLLLLMLQCCFLCAKALARFVSWTITHRERAKRESSSLRFFFLLLVLLCAQKAKTLLQWLYYIILYYECVYEYGCGVGCAVCTRTALRVCGIMRRPIRKRRQIQIIIIIITRSRHIRARNARRHTRARLVSKIRSRAREHLVSFWHTCTRWLYYC